MFRINESTAQLFDLMYDDPIRTPRNAANDFRSSLEKATRYLKHTVTIRPQIAIILGTGLGRLANHIDVSDVVDFGKIPDFPRTTATGHAGQFLFGHIGETPVCAMSGRFHAYEGYGSPQIVLPVFVMNNLGARTLIVSNASGGLNPQYQAGDLMVIEDHMNLMFRHPLGSTTQTTELESFSRCVRRPRYDKNLIKTTIEVANRHNVALQRGVYCSVTGPNYETRAEIRMLQKLGADAVGMSTIPEVTAANGLGMRVLGISVITNLCSTTSTTGPSSDDVIAAAESTEPKLTAIVLNVVQTTE